VTVAPLLQHLLRDADADAERRRAAARARARESIAEAGARLDRRRAALLAARARELARERELHLGAATRRASEATASARRRFVTRVLEAVIERAGTVAALPAAVGRLACDLDEARAFLPEGAVVVRCHPSLAGPVRAMVADAPAGSVRVVDDAALSPGLVVETPDGSIRVDATLRARLEAGHARLSIDLVRQVREESP
jgi:vacuolar-type H+-ATPase subunit E/Vma4